jgi:hypothetical protein
VFSLWITAGGSNGRHVQWFLERSRTVPVTLRAGDAHFATAFGPQVSKKTFSITCHKGSIVGLTCVRSPI